MVVAQEGAVGTVGYDEADGECLMTHDGREAVDGRGLHLEVGQPAAVPRERGEPLVEVGDAGLDTQTASLRGIETRSCSRHGMVHPICHFGEKMLAGISRIGLREAGVELHVFDEGFVERVVELRGVVTVVVEQAVETYGVFRGHEGADRHIAVKRAAGADAHQVEASV